MEAQEGSLHDALLTGAPFEIDTVTGAGPTLPCTFVQSGQLPCGVRESDLDLMR